MAGVEVIWNGVSSTTIPELVFSNPVRALLGEFRGSFLPIPGRVSSWHFPSVRGRREIRVPGHIEASSFPAGRRDALEDFADWLDIDFEAKLTFGDSPDMFYNAVLLDAGDVEEWRELGTFEVTWACSPYQYEEAISTESWFAFDGVAHVWDPDVGMITEFVMEITPLNGTLTAFEIILGNTLNWAGDLASTDTLTVNGIAGVVTTGTSIDTELTGAYPQSELSMAGVTGGFPYLQPGSNSMVFNVNGGTATNFNVNIYYRKAYRR